MPDSRLNASADAAPQCQPDEAWDDRTRTLLGDEAITRLAAARVLVVGTGGVGGYAAEMLCRSGIGHLTLVDADRVAPSNLNRQLIALRSTLGEPKTRLFAERFHDINPDAEITSLQEFLTPETVDALLDRGFDYVVDCIDTVAPKVALLAACLRQRIPVIASMGAGGRTDPTKAGYADLWETREDGLARAVRQRLRKLGLRRQLLTVSSSEAPRAQSVIAIDGRNKRSSFGTLATIPSLFGILLANHVIMRLSNPPT